MTKNIRSVCALTNFLDILGDKWSLLIIRDLFFNETRQYGDLLNLSIGEKPSTNILAARLKHLVQLNLIKKEKDPTDGKKFIYSLTLKGESLEPVLQMMIDWSLENIKGTRAKSLKAESE